MDFIIREVLSWCGVLTGVLVGYDAHNFQLLNCMVALGLFTLLVAFVALRRSLFVRMKYVWRHRIKKHS
ncbi:MAG: hypothetical protein DI628_03330 [Blastochloris viridis]|uniref:Uncharacterized protein n=1 Tax=Blastochloris viridis TaxID=1079 RepID=A0A6N4R498_BLAVI|nr:MAG: hypothetical protein DI628_03330 [Blastochloris viridis]